MSAEWQFLVTLNDRLRQLEEPHERLELAVRLFGEHFHASRVGWSRAESDEFRGGPAIVEACCRGETIAVNDISTDPRVTDATREVFLAQGTAAVVIAPLLKDGRWVGTFSVHSAAPRSWSPEQVALIAIAADHMWAGEQRSDAEDALIRFERRHAFLRRLSDTVGPLAAPAKILKETCRIIGEHLGVNRVLYAEIDGDDCVVVDDYVNDFPSMSGRFSWVRLAGSRTGDILSGRTLIANDVTDAHTPEECTALQAAGIGAYICPLLVKDGRFVAAFGIHARLPRVWTADEISLVEEVAERIWSTLEHRKAEAVLLVNEERLAFLLQFNDAIRPLSDPGEVQQTAARLLGDYLEVSRVGYAELDPHGNTMIGREHVRGDVMPLSGAPAQVTLGPALREALRRGETIAVADINTDPRLRDEDRASFRARQMAAFVGAARLRDGRMTAAFGANNVTPRAWTPQEIELVRDVAERTWDAVERSRAEAAILQHEQRLALAIDASGGGSWTWVAATNQADWDERFRALYGFDPDEASGPDKWPSRVHEEDRPRVMALLGEILSPTGKDSWQHTFRIVRPDGTMAWVQSRGRAERDAEGQISRLSGLDFDFTQQRLLEEASLARQDEEHDRTLRTLLETATQGIVSIDDRGIVVTANRALHDMFGWALGELAGQSIERLLPTPLREGHEGDRARYLAMPHPELMGGRLQMTGERKDGSTFPIEVGLSHVVTPAGGRGFVFVTDITERERAASALQAHAEELEYRTTQLSRMAIDLTLAEQRARQQIASTLHDGLQQYLVIAALDLDQILKRDEGGSAAPSELLHDVRRQLAEAIEAARSLTLELFPPVLQHSGFPAALEWLANWTHEKYKIEVQVDADPQADTPRKEVRTLLFESVRELVFNAVKHAQAERVAIQLALADEEQLCITVTDEGRGFDPATLDDRSNGAHVGWGLFSIRERLTLLGGDLHIDSAPGRGTKVRLVAPRGVAQNTAEQYLFGDPSAGLMPAGDDRRATADALRILLVDDHAAVRNGLRDILHTRPQFQVIGHAANGFEAIAHAHTLRPDVILMDVAMPHMDGLQATARIHAELPEIHILGFSMQAGSAIARALESAGAAAFFVKGIDTQRLIRYLLTLHGTRAAGADAAL